jgi:intraflagellar transport protein 46
MYTDSDDEGANVAGKAQVKSKQKQTPSVQPAIDPSSQYDRVIQFSSGDEEPTPQKKPVKTDKKPMRTKKPGASVKNPARNDWESEGTPRAYADVDDEDPVIQSSGMAALFALIGKFRPDPVDLSVHWRPFLPELTPAIGTIDAFIKVPRPDGEVDDLGLVVVDEPSIKQSNPQVLRMELREQYGVTSPTGTDTDGYVGFLVDPVKTRKALDAWLDSTDDIHRKRPPPTMIYSSLMPEMETLMEVWPPLVDDCLKSVVLPTSDIDLTFDEYARVICALLDIPVRDDNLIDSLHHLFSLYCAFSGNTYFQNGEGGV